MAAFKKRRKFDPQTFLSTVDVGRTIAVFPEKQTIFSQGESSDAVFHIQKGRIKLTVVSKSGKEHPNQGGQKVMLEYGQLN